MADETQVAMLKRSVEEWNEWRRDHFVTRVDLTEASLAEARLRHANLASANLTGADLSGADLSRTYLYQADFSRARLHTASLIGADISWANLSSADLRNARLFEASVRETDFTLANLTTALLDDAVFRSTSFTNADVTGARLGGSVFTRIDFRPIKGLEECVHKEASVLDLPTLKFPKPLPFTFLRGCGLSDNVIKSIPTLFNEPGFYTCFISHSGRDQDFADRLHADLQSIGIRCWFAPHDIRGGRKIHEQIDEAIRVYDRLLLILSEHSMNSEWVKTEIAHARQKELRAKRQVLFPISLVPFEAIRDWKCFDADTGKDSAREIREYYIPDFSQWNDHEAYQAAFERLRSGLKADEQPAE